MRMPVFLAYIDRSFVYQAFHHAPALGQSHAVDN
jgi:hypothetical protein